MRNSGGGNNVSVILSNMLAEYQVNKKGNGYDHEDVEDADGIVDNNDNSHGQALEDMKTMSNGLICKNENILLDYVNNSKKLRAVSMLLTM